MKLKLFPILDVDWEEVVGKMFIGMLASVMLAAVLTVSILCIVTFGWWLLLLPVVFAFFYIFGRWLDKLGTG